MKGQPALRDIHDLGYLKTSVLLCSRQIHFGEAVYVYNLESLWFIHRKGTT